MNMSKSVKRSVSLLLILLMLVSLLPLEAFAAEGGDAEDPGQQVTEELLQPDPEDPQPPAQDSDPDPEDEPPAVETPEDEVCAHTELIYVEEIPATEEADGVRAHWYCAECGKYFADEDAQVELSAEELVLPALQPEQEEPDPAEPGEEEPGEDEEDAEDAQAEEPADAEEEDDVFVIDPAVAYPEAPEDALISLHEIFEDGAEFQRDALPEEVYEELDTTPNGPAWVDPDVVMAYAELVARRRMAAEAEAAQTAAEAAAEAEVVALEPADGAEVYSAEEPALPEEGVAVVAEEAAPDAAVSAEYVPFSQDEAISLWQAVAGETITVSSVSPMAKTLPTPTNVRWDPDRPGAILLDISGSVDGRQIGVDIKVYKDNEFFSSRYYWIDTTLSGTWGFDLSDEDFTTGSYYFTVQLVSEVSSLKSSGVARSGVFNYTEPSARLGTPTNVYRKEDVAYWDPVNNAGGYEVEWTTADNSFMGGSTVRNWNGEQITSCTFPFRTPNRRGFKYTGELGKLCIRVRALSADITQQKNGVYCSWETRRQGKFKYHSELTSKNATYDYTYDEHWFEKSSYTYNQDLVRMSIRMAMAAADTTSGNIQDLMEQLGFQYSTKYSSYPTPGPDTIGYAIGSKIVKTDAGDSFTLVAVTPRGGGYKEEWASNFTVGAATEHYGFAHSANMVYEAVKKYIKNEVTGDVKIWISGYSRGAAVANIAAYRLTADAKYNSIRGLKTNGVYAFCFECPATVIEWAPDSAYYNICVFLNDVDPVAMVPPTIWNYGRIGIVYNLPSSSTTSKYSTSLSKMRTEYVKIAKQSGVGSYSSVAQDRTELVAGQHLLLTGLVDALGLGLGHFEKGLDAAFWYTIESQDTFREAARKFGAGSSGSSIAPLINVLDSVQNPGLRVATAVAVAKVKAYLSRLKYTHFPELSLAWMDAISSNTEYVDSRTRNLRTNCPVDVTVRDSSGSVVAQIVNDEAVPIAGSYIEVMVDENGQKVVCLPMDMEYTVEFTATDDGEMSYQVEEYDVNSCEATRLINYYDIPIEAGDSLAATAGEAYGDTAAYTMSDADANPVEPDSDLSGSEIVRYTLALDAVGGGSISGGGSFLVGEYAAVSAEEVDGWTFLGWYEDGALVSTDSGMRFRMDRDRSLTAVFRETLSEIVLDREYLVLEVGGETAQLSAACAPAEWQEYLKWRVEPAEGEDAVAVSVTEDGVVTAEEPGTAYVVAYVDYRGQTATARCRIDVSGSDGEPVAAAEAIDGAQLLDAAVTVPVYRSEHSAITVIPTMEQNRISAQSTDPAQEPADSGAAVKAAWFENEAARAAFRLRVADDRRLEIIPTAEVLDGSLKLAKSYTSRVVIDLGERLEITDASLKLPPDKTLPKLKAKSAVSFNSFVREQRQTPVFTGGVVTAIRLNEAASGNADWVALAEDGLTLALKPGVTGKHSGKLNVLASVEGWAVELPVTLTLKAASTAPSLKLSATTVTLQADSENSGGVALALKSGKKGVALRDLDVQGLSAPGFLIEDFDPESGSFVLKSDGAPVAGKKQLIVSFANSDSQVTLGFKLKVAAVKPVLSVKKVSLLVSSTDRAEVTVSASPADFRFGTPVLSLTNAKGTVVYNYGGLDEDGLLACDTLRIRYDDGTIYLSSPEDAYAAPGTYKLHVRFSEDGPEAVLTVTVLKSTTKATLKAKAKGTIDLAYPDSSAVITYTTKNYNITGTGESWIYIEGRKGSKVVDFDATDKFRVSSDGYSFTVTATDPANINPSYSYYAVVERAISTGYGARSFSSQVKLSLKKTAVKLKASPAAVVLNPLLEDTASVTLTPSVKKYVLSSPVLRVVSSQTGSEAADELDVVYEDGRLLIRPTEYTQPDAVYMIYVQATPACPETAISVRIESDTAGVVASIKASGSIDIIRPATAVTLTPTYVNCSGQGSYTRTILVMQNGMDVTDRFTAVEAPDGSFTLKANGSPIAYAKGDVFEAQLLLDVNGELVASVPVQFKLTMGSAKAKASAAQLKLPSGDRFATAAFTVAGTDKTLGPVAEVAFADPALSAVYRIDNLGAGRFAVGFANNAGSQPRTDSVKLNVFFQGNGSETANAVVTVKLVVS